jgi:hypothetical protein
MRSRFVAAAAIAAALTVSAAPAAQAEIVGGISVEQYCQSWYGGTHATLRVNNINGWRCSSGPVSTDRTVNFTTACAQQRSTPYWGYHDYYNPYTIFCYR